DPFADASTHSNSDNCPHPYYKGDMPPLFSAGGRAFSAFLSDRFTIDEIIGKAVIIHSSPDDFTTQPSGNAGEKIACGIIKEL
ncbi:MAG: superoxide dismutase family protein, partial [Eubacterium sp.]